MFLLLCAGTLDVWFGEIYLLLPLHHHLLVDLGDDAGGSPVASLLYSWILYCTQDLQANFNPYCIPVLQYLLLYSLLYCIV